MLASSIRIDRPVEANVWRFIAGNNLSRCVDRDRRLEGWKLVERPPAVVEGDAGVLLVAPRRIALCTSSPPTLMVDDDAKEFTDVFIGARRCGGQLLHRRASLGCV
jgi:hypothetical protein